VYDDSNTFTQSFDIEYLQRCFLISANFAPVKQVVLISVVWFSAVTLGWSQTGSNTLFEEGLALEKKFQVEEALIKYEAALQNNPSNAEALTHASRMLSNIGGKVPKSDRKKRRPILEKARDYSQRSIQINPIDPQARLAHIISLGLLSEIATNPHEKVRDARLIHDEAKKILEIDSTFAEAYFVLGKWQHELSKLNWVELMACNFFFGGFPESISMEAALRYFDKAIEFNPSSILFLYGQALAQHELGENQKAVATLNRALALPLAEPDDVLRKDRCEVLLKEIVQ
jgi:tetratricopeptide (TPR) repeat protein